MSGSHKSATRFALASLLFGTTVGCIPMGQHRGPDMSAVRDGTYCPKVGDSREDVIKHLSDDFHSDFVGDQEIMTWTESNVTATFNAASVLLPILQDPTMGAKSTSTMIQVTVRQGRVISVNGMPGDTGSAARAAVSSAKGDPGN